MISNSLENRNIQIEQVMNYQKQKIDISYSDYYY